MSEDQAESMTKPGVSILIPAHNEEDNLNRIIDLYAKQTLPRGLEMEIVVNLNCCTDNSERIMRRKSQEYPFVRYTFSEIPGKNHAINMLAHTAKSNFLIFSDADIIPMGGLVQVLYEDLQANPQFRAIGAHMETILPKKKRKLMDLVNSILKKCPVKHHVTGQLFCIRKKEYIPIPEDVISEDQYINIMFCLDKVKRNLDAVAYFKRPDSLLDYFSYRIRIERAKAQLAEKYPEEMKKYMGQFKEQERWREKKKFIKSLTLAEKLVAPFVGVIYHAAQAVGRLHYRIYGPQKTWAPIATTKKMEGPIIADLIALTYCGNYQHSGKSKIS